METFEANPIVLHGRQGRGPMSRFSIAACIFVPCGGLMVLASLFVASWGMGAVAIERPDNITPGNLLYAALLLAIIGVGMILLFLEDLRSFKDRRMSRSAKKPWMQDYHWNPQGHWIRVWSDISTAVYLIVTIIVGFPALLFWVSLDGRAILSLLLALLVGLFMSYLLVRELLRYLKYGDTWLRYHKFPYHPGDKVVLTWGIQRPVREYNRIHFILRYVEEIRREEHRRNEVRVVYKPEQQWAQTYTLDSLDPDAPKLTGHEQTVGYIVPADAPGTNLRADPPRYWEFEIHIEAPGVDYQRTYPVPIYAKP